MLKRAVNLFGAGAVNRKNHARRLRQAACEAHRQAVEKLEDRVLLSAGNLPIVNILWKGAEVPAVQGQYIAQTSNSSAWSNLAAKEDFTNIRSLGGNGYYQFDSALSPAQIAQLSQNHPVALTLVEPNLVGHLANTFPNDPLAVDQYHLLNTGQVESFDYNLDGVIEPFENQVGIAGQDINAQQAWDITTGSSNVVVAVLDSGVDVVHPDLAANIWTNPNPNGQPGFPNDVNGWNFVSNNNNVLDDNGHGTNVAGIIGAIGNNSIGVTGVNWHVTILPVKVAAANGTYRIGDEIAGINYVTMLKSQGTNIVVMNESLGGPNFPFNTVENNVVKAAGVSGIVDVVAAGNSSQNLDRQQESPGKFSIGNGNVITVAATDNQGKLANFSNFGGSSVDLAAPGVDILSTAPTEFTVAGINYVSPLYGSESGTSQATPQVAGIIALEAAAKPNATPQQLKKALLDGVTFDSNLASVNGLPPKVLTSGVANAYRAVKNILDQFVTSDTTRAGNWQGFYGTSGAYIVGDSTAFPSFVTGNFDAVSPVILKDSTHLIYAPQKISDPTSRIEAYDASNTSEAINLSFTDGNAHRVGLYVADLDHKHRTEVVQIVDVPTGQILDSQVVSNFKKGEYLFWDLRGSIQIRLTNLAGPSAVFSGIFFDPVPGNANVFTGIDSNTLGSNWRDTYGSQGAFIAGDGGSILPSYVATVSAPLAATQIVKSSTKAKQALQRTLNITHNIEAYWVAPGPFDINVVMNNSQPHQVTLYLADYDRKRRAERIQVIDPVSGSVLYTQDFFNFTNGAFASFTVPGSVNFHVIPMGGPSAVVSGVFFDAAPGAAVRFTGTDAGTEGNWKSAGYGATFAEVVGKNFSGVDNHLDPTIFVTNGTEKILNSLTTDPRALLQPDNSPTGNRIASYIFTNSFMTLSVNFHDNLQHHVALYFADYEKLKRVESVTITDPETGTVLAQQRLSNFANGKYLLYDVTGPVNITIVAGSVSSAVLSGLFSD